MHVKRCIQSKLEVRGLLSRCLVVRSQCWTLTSAAVLRCAGASLCVGGGEGHAPPLHGVRASVKGECERRV
eukprot:365964-Chlamydomonas_euryale.AAC.2